jgi:predicted AAA+ superfamily ATPase
VAKTTLLLQYLKQLNEPEKSIYISMDHFYFQKESMYETVKSLYQQGYRYFVLDEVHKYLNWSIELKSLYDTYRELKIIFTGSSALEIYKSNADLSRRAVDFQLPVLSLREFIAMETGKVLEPLSIEELLANHTSIALAINKKIGSPLKYFKNYLQYGCYPFFVEGKNQYPTKLMRTTNLVLEVDIAAVTNIPFNSIYKMKRLLAFISQSVPLGIKLLMQSKNNQTITLQNEIIQTIE